MSPMTTFVTCFSGTGKTGFAVQADSRSNYHWVLKVAGGVGFQSVAAHDRTAVDRVGFLSGRGGCLI